MILLDTNVLSEALRPAPCPAVLRWLAQQEPLSVFTTTITQAEILYGIEILPAGKRKRALAAAVAQIFDEDSRGTSLATRNTSNFERCGLRLLDPWIS